jgi:ATP-dependent DNA ligase
MTFGSPISTPLKGFSSMRQQQQYAQNNVSTLHPDARDQGPAGPDWLHEIKHDGYRLIVQSEASACGC